MAIIAGASHNLCHNKSEKLSADYTGRRRWSRGHCRPEGCDANCDCVATVGARGGRARGRRSAISALTAERFAWPPHYDANAMESCNQLKGFSWESSLTVPRKCYQSEAHLLNIRELSMIVCMHMQCLRLFPVFRKGSAYSKYSLWGSERPLARSHFLTLHIQSHVQGNP